MTTIAKIHMGQEIEHDDGEKLIHMGGTCFAAINDRGQIVLDKNGEPKMHKTKQILHFQLFGTLE